MTAERISWHRRLLRAAVPFPVRVAIMRARRAPVWNAEHASFVLLKAPEGEYPNVLAEHRSPLRRPGTTYAPKLQEGKERNVELVASLIDGTVVEPGQTFSYHHTVGCPSKHRGFVRGAELQDGDLTPGIGGGACQCSNLLYVLALLAGAEIVERHRHGLDLFPDSERTVPFGCGATVFFNLHDLRFKNALSVPIRIGLGIEDGFLVGRAFTAEPSRVHFKLREIETEFRKEGEVWIRENRVGRQEVDVNGSVLREEEIAHNVARCLYDPTDR